MPETPRWIGFVGMLLTLAFCGFILAGQLLLGVLVMIASIALVVLESRYDRGLMGVRRD